MLTSSINVTADGFCGHLDAIADEEHHEFALDLLKNADILLLGRRTYQLFESFWPNALNDLTLPESVLQFARVLDNAKKIVATKTLKNVGWKNTTTIATVDSKALSVFSDKKVLIFGSPDLVSDLSRQGLIDRYYLTVQPIIAGQGKRLFDSLNLPVKQTLTLTDTRQFKSGVTTLFYSTNRK
jgi:dihydrofolate reductase